MEKKVPTLSKYIDSKRTATPEADVALNEILIFNLFCQSTPVLGDFIPCDKDNKPMEKPLPFEEFRFDTGLEYLEWNNAMKEWEEAGKRVKWVGWSLRNGIVSNGEGIGIELDKITEGEGLPVFIMMGSESCFESYEELINDIPLLPTEQTQTDLKLN